MSTFSDQRTTSLLPKLPSLLISSNTRSGGDTEVDVNDVAFALGKVIEMRQAEDTWQVDSFGGVPVKSRTPDEVILVSFCREAMHPPLIMPRHVGDYAMSRSQPINEQKVSYQ